ncbi:MAG: hypothetical protein ACJA08_001748 [Cyclobacteriaceae bacterium]|jgi:hypothetical protein
MELLTNNLIHNAVTEYEEVLEELNKPKKDLVMIASCHLVKKSIGDFLGAYLSEKGAENLVNYDILQMQKDCIKFNKEFEKLDLTSIALLCQPSNSLYTNELDTDRLNRYVATMKQTRDIVIRSLRM